MLHITSGDFESAKLRELGIEGSFLGWSDLLTEGPVPAGMSLDELSQIRAAFIAQNGWGSDYETLTHFQSRDACLRSAAASDEVTLWCSPGLSSLLLTLQVLDWFRHEGREHARPALIRMPADISQMQQDDVQQAYRHRQPVTDSLWQQAADSWDMFQSSNPRGLLQLAAQHDTAWPELTSALLRLLQQYPDHTGLNLSQRRALEVLKETPQTTAELMRKLHELEALPFMTESSFWKMLEQLESNRSPLIETATGVSLGKPGLFGADQALLDTNLVLTERGTHLLSGNGDWLRENDADFWIGGVHFYGEDSWRFIRDESRLQRGAG